MSAVFVSRGVAQDGRLVRQTGRAIEVHEQCQPRVARRLLRPADDELFAVGVQVSLAKRIDGVEQLLQFGDVDFDDLAAWRDRIAGRFAVDLTRCTSVIAMWWGHEPGTVVPMTSAIES